ncbi:MAG TPA: beta-galactosidase [Pontiellaceae bacterium]|nr:beta-galactosidase [Pontiellaceae bacterium]HPR83417.1 beta-galactosidase [Pontiellaceae bacterium]
MANRLKRLIGLSLFLLIATFRTGCAETAGTFQAGESDFLLNGKPFVIRSGELHYSRVPREYWQHRLQMCKAMGFNTVCAYMFWSVHEPEPGQFDFSGPADVAAFCRLAQQEGLKVILRPGPYSCAEWDFGGFPYWLLKDETMRVRTQHAGFMQACERYINRVGKELSPLQFANGGPIIMVQVENEYGAYGSDKEYIGRLRDCLRNAGFDKTMFFTCDAPRRLTNDVRDDIFCVANFGQNPKAGLEVLRKVRPSGPLMCGEFYPGWFDSWGLKHHVRSAEETIVDLQYMLERRISFSLYMAHGGTSFGFAPGALLDKGYYAPNITSYDYDAPINEAGWDTPKYHALRELYSRYLEPGETLPPIPARKPVITLPEIRLTETAPLLTSATACIDSPLPRPFELYSQSHGCVLYTTKLPPGPAGTLAFPAINDWARIYVDGQAVSTYDRRLVAEADPVEPSQLEIAGFEDAKKEKEGAAAQKFTLAVPARSSEVELSILVEALGRIHYSKAMGSNYKGLLGAVQLDGRELTGWQAHLLPLTAPHLAALKFSKAPASGPSFYRAQFTLDKTGDTFLDMRNWTKGVVWVNGHNLGRYWNVGPSQTLYLPAPWLKTGQNEIIVLDLFEPKKTAVQGLAEPILDQPAP